MIKAIARIFSSGNSLYNTNDYTVSARNSSTIIREYGDLIIEVMKTSPSKRIADAVT